LEAQNVKQDWGRKDKNFKNFLNEKKRKLKKTGNRLIKNESSVKKNMKKRGFLKKNKELPNLKRVAGV